ncbi:MAG: BRO family protein [Akkermansiaceae bacterium]
MSHEITPFESIRSTNPAGNEYWSSRDFARVLGYADYRNFQSVIESARTACFNSGQRVDDHFVEVTDMIKVGKGAMRPAKTVMMSRYAIFQNHGYVGLYGGLGAQDIHRRKGLKKGEQILDHMGSTELAANLFRATQAEEKLRREKITGKEKANKAHREVGAKVRQTIKELGGTMPEELPTVESIKKLESRAKRALKKPRNLQDGEGRPKP